MGKRSEKSSKDRSPKSDDLNSGKKIDNYEAIGHFEQDFLNLCLQKNTEYLPSVVTRSLRPSTTIASTESTVSTALKKPKEEKKAGHLPSPLTQVPNETFTETPGSRPATFRLTETLAFFKPKVQIQTENNEKSEYTTDVHVRGWLIGDRIFSVLLDCLSAATKLHTVNFWRVGLSSAQITQLASFLSINNTIRQLTIDANEKLDDSCLAQLIDDSINLTKLQLRYCCLGPAEAKHIAMRLGTTTSANSKLLSLDLSGNQLGDQGTIYLAEALRTNRTLLTLSLSNNDIGDIGAGALATVLSQFFLTHDEIVQRRLLISEMFLSENASQKQRTPSEGRRSKSGHDYRDSSKEGSGQRKRERSNRSRPTKEQDQKEEKVATKGKKTENSPPKKGVEDSEFDGSRIDLSESDDSSANPNGSKTAPKGKPGRTSRNAKQVADQVPIDGSPDLAQNVHPFLEKPEYVDPYGLRVTGNFVVAFLNLSRNKISCSGLEKLLSTVKFQVELLNSGTKVNGTGLMKLLLRGNQFDETCKEMRSLMDVIMLRDPFAKGSLTADGEIPPAEPQLSC